MMRIWGIGKLRKLTRGLRNRFAPGSLLQQQEIQQSKTRLEEILGHQAGSFAYPFGNYNAVTIDVVRNTRFTFACSTIHANVKRNSDRFVLPRVEVQNWNGDELAKRLSRRFDV